MSASDPLRIVFMGTPAFAVPTLDALANAGYNIIGVYTQPDRRSGRGRRYTPSPVKRAAQARSIPVFQPASLRRDADARRQLRLLAPQLIVVAAYGLFLPPETLAVPPLGALNIHPSLLPRYRGPSPVAAAILNGDTTTGVSIMQIDEGMDSGPILAQRQTPIRDDEAADALTHRLFAMGAALLADILPRWTAGEITPQPQDENAVVVTHLLSRQDGAIDWQQPASHIARQVRAYHPWPSSFTRWRNRQLKILQASADHTSRAPSVPAPPGKVAPLPDGISVSCGEGMLRLQRVQLEGRQALDIADFLKGYPDFAESQLG